MTLTPEARPCKASSVRTAFTFSMSALLIVEIAPETLVIFWVPYPTTITSFKLDSATSVNSKLTVPAADTFFSTLFMPT